MFIDTVWVQPLLTKLSHLPLALSSIGGEEVPKDLLTQLIRSNLFNVLLALALIVWLFKKFNILASLDSHGTKIADELSKAEEDRKLARAGLQSVQARLSSVHQEVDTILKQAHNAAELVASQILNNAESEAARIIEAGRQRVLLEERSGAKNLQARLLKETVLETRYHLADRLVDPHDRRRTIEQFIDELPGLKVTPL